MSDPKLDLAKLNSSLRFRQTYERWADKVQTPPKGHEQEECWHWLGSKRGGRGKGGQYGQFWYDDKPGYAHRYSYEVHHGPIPENYEVDHVCQNRLCCNPWHLRLLPRRSNRRRTTKRKEVKWGGDKSK